MKPAQSSNPDALKYERTWRAYLRHTHEQFLKRVFTAPGEVLLDVSGGTGLLAEELIDSRYPFGRLVLNDPCDKMLDAARSRLGNNSRISFTGHPARALPFNDEQFDRILCLNAFHCYTEQEQVMQRFVHLLKPGGRLYLLDWNRSGFFRIVNRVIQWTVANQIDTRSLAEMTRLAKNCGFIVESADSWRWRYWKFLFLEAVKTESR